MPLFLPAVSVVLRIIGAHDMYYQHRVLGYLFLTLLELGAVAWWLAMYHDCAINGNKSCTAMYPEGNYFNIKGPPFYCTDEFLAQGTAARGHVTRFRSYFKYDHCVNRDEDGNPGAVLFLREAVVTLMLCLLFAAEFKYPLLNVLKSEPPADKTKAEKELQKFPSRVDAVMKFPLLKLIDLFFTFSKRWLWENVIEQNQFEIFMYVHIISTYIVALAAFFSRMEVFYGAAFCWAIYAVDRLYVIIFRTHTFRFSPRDSAEYQGAFKLTLKKRNGLAWRSQPGQIVFLHCPRLGMFWLGRQWHAFSLASSSCENVDEDQDRVELLIQVTPC
jgi:hypothetical protein